MRYSWAGALVPAFAAAERAVAWSRRNISWPAIMPESPGLAGPDPLPAVAEKRSRSAGLACRLGPAILSAHHGPARIRGVSQDAGRVHAGFKSRRITDDRPELINYLKVLRDGDTLIVWQLGPSARTQRRSTLQDDPAKVGLAIASVG